MCVCVCMYARACVFVLSRTRLLAAKVDECCFSSGSLSGSADGDGGGDGGGSGGDGGGGGGGGDRGGGGN